MHTHTKQVLVLALLSFAGAGTAVGLLTYEIDRTGDMLSAHVAVLGEHAATQQNRARLSRLAETTAPERTELADYFLESSDDSIDLLNTLETLAADFGLTGNPTDLTTGSEGNTTYVEVPFRFRGSKQAVTDFSRALEFLPYQAELRSLSLTRGSGNSWEGTARVRVITLQP